MCDKSIVEYEQGSANLIWNSYFQLFDVFSGKIKINLKVGDGLIKEGRKI